MQLNRWQIRFDGDSAGLAERWYDPDAPAHDGPGWRDTAVPGAWNQAFGDDSPDVAWYRTTFPIQHDPGSRLWLRFGAVCTRLDAWCDGQPIGEHAGNWEPFDLELPALSHNTAQCVIVLRVDRVRPAPATKVGERVVEHGHITKGFHDILSRQPAGLWQPVELRRTGPHALDPLGLTALADRETGAVTLDLLTHPGPGGATARMTVRDPAGRVVAEDVAVLDGGTARCRLVVGQPEPWSPDRPALYTARCRLIDAEGRESDATSRRFGFRMAETRGRRLLLNGKPIHLSAMLDWGHEPMQTAPAPSPAEVRRRFHALRAMGINCVCICLWYAPPHVYDIADETGMLLWQEHPVWKPDMNDGNRTQFQQHFERFFRRDVSHPSVVIVSGSCEHDAMDPKLAAWWWRRANKLMPDRLLQVQTAFLRLVPPEQTDLYDEHTYENSGRWPEFLADMDATLAPLPDKPFVMGESVLYNDWPDVPGLLAAVGGDRPWWVSRVLGHADRIERQIAERYGRETLDRFRRDARRWHLAGRKWQTEVFRHNADHAGLVQNGLRDVAQCPLGFMDDFDAWKLTPGETRPWLAPNALLLRTPGHLRAFQAGQPLDLELGAASFGETPVGQTVELCIDAPALNLRHRASLTLATEPGEVAWARCSAELPVVDEPVALEVVASAEGAPTNRWQLWALPDPGPVPAGTAVVAPTRVAQPPVFAEASYSSGWGLGVTSWTMAAPDAAVLLPEADRVEDDALPDAGVLVAHALSPAVLAYAERGGRVLLLPDGPPGDDPMPDATPLIIPTLWGQSPLVLAHGPLAGVDPQLILDTLDRDLHHRWVRTVPTGELGIADDVLPILRLIHTHDSVGRINLTDDLFAFGHGSGTVLVSALDHTTPAGAWLLRRLLAWLADEQTTVSATLDGQQLDALRRVGTHTPDAQPATKA